MRSPAVILALLMLISCAPPEIPQQAETPVPPTPEQPGESNQPITDTMKITIGGTVFTAILATNAAATAFKAMLPLTLTMSDFNDNEKVCSLPNSLPVTASNPNIIQTGDIMLYGSSSLVLFYQTFPTSYSYTRIGTIDHPAGLQTALGSSSVTLKFEMQ